MKIYGEGLLEVGGRVVHDFIDGPFETDNEVYLRAAKDCGFSVGEPAPVAEVQMNEIKSKRGRPARNK
jgi:hypothetical protein